MSAAVQSSPEVSSSHAAAAEVDEEELDLGLFLGGKKPVKTGGGGRRLRGEFCRILTAEDFPAMARPSRPVSSPSSSSDSSSSSLGAATKRAAADSASPDAGGSHNPRQLVGWPPVRAYRMNNLFSQSRGNVADDNHNAQKKNFTTQTGHGRKTTSNVQENAVAKCYGKKSSPLLVKVNKDGDPIGRKVDLNAHTSYSSLILALEDMFQEKPSLKPSPQISKASRLLDDSSEFILTYEDRDGDWMLVGDVPWSMFLGTVRRLRIMRSDANGLG